MQITTDTYDTLGTILGTGYRDEKARTILWRGFEFSGNWNHIAL